MVRTYKWAADEDHVRVLVVLENDTVFMHNQNCYPIPVSSKTVFDNATGRSMEELRRAALCGVRELKKLTHLDWIECSTGC